ncbi:MAG: HlyD family secretion protein [Anaerolineae bacterium]
MNWKGLIISLAAVAVISGAGLLLYSRRQVAAQEAAAQPTAVRTEPLAQVAADGYVVPQRYAVLSLSVPGTVAEVYAAEGDQVQAGVPLLALENSSQVAALAQAQAGLAQAEANLAQFKAGARPEEVAQAQAAVAAAQARLDRLTSGATPEQIASAEQSVAAAQANLELVQAGPTPEQLTAADATLRLAEASLEQAQAAYDKVAGRADAGMLPQSLQLEQATIEYERAQASYQDLVNGATPAEIKVYQEQVAQAQASLAEVLAGANPADVVAAQADLAAAQAALELVQAGARPEELAAAEAQVQAAQASVDLAQAALDATILKAPFAGTVSSISLAVGEYAAPGLPLVRLGDVSAWLVETDNLSELDVVKLAVGDAVQVSFDALPGAVIKGRVQHIQPAAEVKRGDVTYTVAVVLEANDLPLRWGMTAAIRK